MSAALDADIAVTVGSGDRVFSLEARLTLASGVLVLFGPSGAGKSLTLQAVGGLLRGVRGRVAVGDECLLDTKRGIDVPASARGVGYVPQQHALFPFLDVLGNVGFGLPRSSRGGPVVTALVEELGLARLARARPDALSGGERQRVALGRALAVAPRLLLLDEPFASIDGRGRAELRRLLRELLDRRRMPAILVTHDPEDAVAIGDAVVLLDRGRSVAWGSPREILAPASFRITGVRRSEDEPVPLPEGRARVKLSVEIEGPADALAGAAIDLDLVAPAVASPVHERNAACQPEAGPRAHEKRSVPAEGWSASTRERSVPAEGWSASTRERSVPAEGWSASTQETPRANRRLVRENTRKTDR